MHKFHWILLIFLFIFAGCSTKNRSVNNYKPLGNAQAWKKNNSRINKYIKVYSKNKHVQTCLLRAKSRRYLYYIHRVFYKYNLPPELAHLPILESCFDSKADSGHARGLWQFTKATATDYGLKVSWMSDERLHWRKSTHSAARYLEKLGKRFNYNWEIALAGYNGGPNYVDKLMKKQGTKNFWKLKLRQETSEYVPKFLAMLHVARKKYPELYFQGAPKKWASSS